MIAGAILVATTTAVAQMGVRHCRQTVPKISIEGAVNNDIQLLQQADSISPINN